jgi:hypothetical protein
MEAVLLGGLEVDVGLLHLLLLLLVVVALLDLGEALALCAHHAAVQVAHQLLRLLRQENAGG